MRRAVWTSRQALGVVAAALAVVALGTCAGPADERGRPPRDPGVEPRCAEDDPCWDCETMGNLVCGPP